MKRRILSILTALALCLSLCPTWALAAGNTGTEAGSWTCGSSVTATLSEDGASAPVASVTKTNGDVIYVGKLADAFATTDASRSGATVKLLADVTTESSIILLNRYIDFTLTLDLNGHTITGSSGVITLRDLGFKLTIRGSGSITTSAGDAISIDPIGGNLTLEGGTFSSAAQDGHGVYAAGGNLTVTGEGVTVDRLGATNASVFLTAGTYTGNPAIAAAGKTPVDLLGNRANAYYRDGKPIARADLAEPLAGPVTVKACQHPGAKLTCNNDGTHYLTCICCPAAATSAPEPCTYVFPETGDNRNTGSCVCGSKVIVTVTGTEGLVYNGYDKIPSVTVTRDGRTLQSVTEYRVAYSNNRNAGPNASVTVTMGGESWKGSGTYTHTFSIAKADLEASVDDLFRDGLASGRYGAKLSELPVYGLTAKLKGTDRPVSGTWELEGDAIPSVSDSGKEVTATFVPSDGADNCNPLTAKVKLSISQAEPLVPKTGDLAVTNKQAHTYTYGLGALRPEVPEGLSLGSSAVTYRLEAVDLGSYYSGSGAKIEGQTLTLPIEAVESEEVKEIGTITVAIHTGNYMDMTATMLAADTDHTAEIPTETAAGTYTVTITGKGNYTGTAAATFTINPVETGDEFEDESGTTLRLEVETGLSTVPEALKNNTKYDTPAKIEAELRTRVEQVMSNVGEDIAVFDVTLQYKDESGTWHTVRRKSCGHKQGAAFQ